MFEIKIVIGLAVLLVVLFLVLRPTSYGKGLPPKKITSWQPIRNYDDFVDAAKETSFRGNHMPAPFGQAGQENAYYVTDAFKRSIADLSPEQKVLVLEAIRYPDRRMDLSGLTAGDVPGIGYDVVSNEDAAAWISTKERELSAKQAKASSDMREWIDQL